MAGSSVFFVIQQRTSAVPETTCNTPVADRDFDKDYSSLSGRAGVITELFKSLDNKMY